MSNIIIKNKEQIEGIKKSCILSASTLNYIKDFISPGISTKALNDLAERFIRENGGIPAPLGYKGYPAATCISLNETICHGIPSDKIILKNGDIIKIDISTILNGYYGDTCATFPIGKISDLALKLINATKKCLEIGIEQVFPGKHIGNIGYFISKYIKNTEFSIVTQLGGHGTGINFHEPPTVLHEATQNSGEIMMPGMIFTIEPMINVGKSTAVLDARDGWTIKTIDNSLSAQFEHTILVSNDGYEILTKL